MKTNPRKDKTLMSLWLDKAEVESLKESIKMLELEKDDYGKRNIVEIIQEANKRGDLYG